MKKNLIILVGTICIIFSCKKNEETQLLEEKKITKDSIANVEKLLMQQIRQDSIEQSNIKGYSIEKISGKHKYGGSTTIEYKNLSQLLQDDAKEADKEMRSEVDRNERIFYFKKNYIGGQIRLDIERITIGSANFEDFSVIIKDLNDNELYRYELEPDIPETPNSKDMWWNINLTNIDKKIKAPFYVYVVDDLADSPFKFKITDIRK